MRSAFALLLLVAAVGCDSGPEPELFVVAFLDDQGDALFGYDLLVGLPGPGASSRGEVKLVANPNGTGDTVGTVRVSRADDGLLTFDLDLADIGGDRYELIGRESADGGLISGDAFLVTDRRFRQFGFTVRRR